MIDLQHEQTLKKMLFSLQFAYDTERRCRGVLSFFNDDETVDAVCFAKKIRADVEKSISSLLEKIDGFLQNRTDEELNCLARNVGWEMAQLHLDSDKVFWDRFNYGELSNFYNFASKNLLKNIFSDCREN